MFCLIIATPFIIKTNVFFVKEEFIEAGLIVILLLIGYRIVWLYSSQIYKLDKDLSRIEQDKVGLENRLNDDFKYIGGINIQIDAIRSAFAEIRKYPKDKKEMKQVMELLAVTALRIVDVEKIKTIRELAETRGSAILIKHKLSNRDLLKNRKNVDYITVCSEQKNMTIKGFCILPKINLTREQEVMLMALVNQLEMLFIIFDSRYYKQGE